MGTAALCLDKSKYQEEYFFPVSPATTLLLEVCMFVSVNLLGGGVREQLYLCLCYVIGVEWEAVASK